jgi:hypothetical protein
MSFYHLGNFIDLGSTAPSGAKSYARKGLKKNLEALAGETKLL